MADTNTVVHMGENSPEQIAYRLLINVASLERKSLHGSDQNAADRKWLLDTYAECLDTVRGYRKHP
jgi:hypothetical protein